MAVGNFKAFWSFRQNLDNGNIDWKTSPITMAVLDATYTLNRAHTLWSDVSAFEISDADYAQVALTGKQVLLDVSNRTVLDADDVTFGDPVTIAGKWGLIHVASGVPATSYLCGSIDLNVGSAANIGSTNALFRIGFDAEGIYRTTDVTA